MALPPGYSYEAGSGPAASTPTPTPSQATTTTQAQAPSGMNLPEGYSLEGSPEAAQAQVAAKQQARKSFDVGKALGGMHGGSYDIAFRDPEGQISPDTIKAEAVGGAAGNAVDYAPSVIAAVAPKVAQIGGSVVDKAKAVASWAKDHPIKAYALEQIGNELGVHPFDLMHKAVKYGASLFGDDSSK